MQQDQQQPTISNNQNNLNDARADAAAVLKSSVQPIAPTIQAASQNNLQSNTASLTTPGTSQIQNNQPTVNTPAQTEQAQKNTKQIKNKSKEQPNTTQNSLVISEIREGMVILNDGSFRAIVVCDSINYDLMSSEERNGVEYSYQNFLNTLNFPIQIVVQSRKVDLKNYTDKLEKIRSQQENMLLGVLMDEYLDFIYDIAEQANIMQKNFFVVVPYSLTGEIDSAVNSFKNLSDGMIAAVQQPGNIKISSKDYLKAKQEINTRVTTVINGLMNIGVRAGQMPTQALSELYYNVYNPDTAINEMLGDPNNYTGFYTKKGNGEAKLPGMEFM